MKWKYDNVYRFTTNRLSCRHNRFCSLITLEESNILTIINFSYLPLKHYSRQFKWKYVNIFIISRLIPGENELLTRIYIIISFTLTASLWHLVPCILTKNNVRYAEERSSSPQLLIDNLISGRINGTLEQCGEMDTYSLQQRW